VRVSVCVRVHVCIHVPVCEDICMCVCARACVCMRGSKSDHTNDPTSDTNPNQPNSTQQTLSPHLPPPSPPPPPASSSSTTCLSIPSNHVRTVQSTVHSVPNGRAPRLACGHALRQLVVGDAVGARTHRHTHRQTHTRTHVHRNTDTHKHRQDTIRNWTLAWYEDGCTFDGYK
jgi:hypothetical protein